jgi:D-alanyl-D-alanine carboxypeptidase
MTRDRVAVKVPVGFFSFAVLTLSAFASCETSIHPDFTITKTEFADAVRDLPAGIRTRITEEPVAFLDFVKKLLAEPQDLFAVVDKEHALSRSDEPPGLVRLDAGSLALAKNGLRLRNEATEALVEMSRAASADGVTLVVGSTYRSFVDQESVYARWVKVLGQAEADRESARPGHSQHQLGTTVDFSPIDERFGGTKADVWLRGHSAAYGFSMSYPEESEPATGYIHEPWHYRYIGRAAAEMVGKFFLGSQHHFLEFYAVREGFFRKALRRPKQ